MEPILIEEQTLLQDSARKVMIRVAGPERAREVRNNAAGLRREAWKELAEAGWLAILVPEEQDGLGLGTIELALVLEQSGGALLLEPVGLAAAAAETIAMSDNAALQETLLAAIVAGDKIVLPAMQETALAVGPEDAGTIAQSNNDGLTLTGAKNFIAGAEAADGFLVNAQGAQGTVLCYVPRDADGTHLTQSRNVDGSGTGTLVMDGTPVYGANIVAGANLAPQLAHLMVERIVIGLGAELLGVMDRALSEALDYLKARIQFDRPIGSFQALQYRAVNDYMDVELTRSLIYQVAAMADDGRDVSAMASAVKAKASRAALTVTKSAIQFHGAIGFTDEHDIGLYLKRAMSLAAQHGNEAAHRRRYARLTGIEPAA